MKLKVEGVQAPLEFVEPKLNPIILGLVRGLAPYYMKASLGLSIRPPENMDRLISEYRDFFDEKSRLVLVFRHTHVHDAQVIFYLLNHMLPRGAAGPSSGERLQRNPHAHFLYGRGVPVWGGRWMEWLFSRVGGIPVFHRKLDRGALDTVRTYMNDGPYPIALAPEGQVTYHNEVVHPIEPGFAQIALWSYTDLRARGVSKDVRVLPIAQYYRYGEDGERVLRELIEMLRQEIGADHDNGTGSDNDLTGALRHAGAALFSRIEHFYTKYYGLRDFSSAGGATAGGAPGNSPTAGGPISARECSRRRVERIVDAVLKLQERKFGIHHPPAGLTPRIFVVRQAGYSRIFPDDNGCERSVSSLDNSLNNYLAVDAGLFARHLELVDLLAYLQPEHALESDDVNRHIEFALNLLDAVSRMKGGTIGQRHHVRPCEVSIRIGEAISLDEHTAEFPGMSLRQRRQSLVDEVSRRFEELSTGNRNS